MSFLHRFFALFRRAKLDREMDEEMRTHLAHETEQNIARGMAPDDARCAARRAFGGLEQIKECERDVRAFRWLEEAWSDLRNTGRHLRRSPGFAATAVLTLALGLTVNVMIFSVASDLFLRPLPATDPDRLVVLAQKIPKFQVNLPVSYPDFLDFRRQVEAGGADTPELARAFAGMMAYRQEEVHLRRTGTDIERAWVHAASNNYFSVLGVNPQLGRLFLPTEGQASGADPIIVLTDACWRTRFGGDPHVVGQQVNLNGVPFTVVGVTPAGFVGAAWGTGISGFVPITMHPQISPENSGMIHGRGDVACFLVGRLQPGSSVAQARTAAILMMDRLLTEYPDYHAVGTSMVVLPENRSRPSPYVASHAPFILAALQVLSLLVLVVAAANVANLLYARAADRERELALRGALGASRGRLLRHLLTESLLLALSAGIVGTVAALLLQPSIDRLTPPGSAPPTDTGVDWRLFVFTLMASAATGLFTGLLPALKATRLEVLPLLKGDSPSGSRTRHPWRSLLVVGQVAVSSVVLVGAGLSVRSLHQLSQLKLGFQPDRLLVASLDLGRQRYTREAGVRFQADLRERVRALPGVSSVSIADHVPFDVELRRRGDISAEGEPPRREAEFEFTICQSVDFNYVATLGMGVAEGRSFTEHDSADAPPVAVVSRALARHLWPNESAIGRRLLINQRPPGLEVVGVLGAMRFGNMAASSERFLFRPLAQNYEGRIRLIVRTEADPLLLASTVRQIVREMDPDLPLADLRTFEDHMARSPSALLMPRIGALLAGSQGVIALLLATLGIFGLVSFAVTRRTREIGIRIALGATRAEVMRLVTRDGVRLVVIGLAAGLLAALGVARAVSGLLYGISSTDPIVFLAVPAVVLAVALLGCWLPIRRAMRVNPVDALRSE